MFKPYGILSLYVARRCSLTVAGTLGALLLLVFMLDVIELLRRTVGTDVDVGTLMSLSLMKLPRMSHQILPFAVLAGTMIVLWRLNRSHELVVMRAAGVSVWQFLAPMMACAFVFGAAEVMVLNPLSSALYKQYESRLDRLLKPDQAHAFNVLETGMWLREPDKDGGQIVVRVGHVQQDGATLNLTDLSFIMLDHHGRLYRRIDARHGVMRDQRFLLQDAWIMEPHRPSVRLDQITLPTGMTLERVHENFAAPETLSFWDLPGFIAFFEASGFSAQRHWMYFYSLLSFPFLLCAMVMVAAVFSITRHTRATKVLSHVLGAIGVGFGVYFFNKLSAALGLTAAAPLWLSAATPTLVTLLFGTAVLLSREDG